MACRDYITSDELLRPPEPGSKERSSEAQTSIIWIQPVRKRRFSTGKKKPPGPTGGFREEGRQVHHIVTYEA